MESYVRPDEQFLWSKEGTLLTEAASERYAISYTDGFLETSQRGEGSLSPSRAIVLVISEPELSDAGLYTCGVNGTSQFATVLITVEDPNGECRNSDFFTARCS